jgi:hypothetical protein
MIDKHPQQHDVLPPYLFPLLEDKTTALHEFFPERTPAWPELVEKFKEHKTQTPLSFCLPELQIETLFYLACRASGIPACTSSVYNVPLTLLLIRTMQPDALVSQPELAEKIITLLEKNNEVIPFKLVYLFGAGRLSEKCLTACGTNVEIHYGNHPLRSS